jgi:hypothetical protein
MDSETEVRSAVSTRVTPAASIARKTGWFGVGLGLIALVLSVSTPTPLRVAGECLIAFTAGGTGILCWFESDDGLSQFGLTIVLSLSTLAIGAAAMIWAAAWHPTLLSESFNAVRFVSCAVSLRYSKGSRNFRSQTSER